MNFFTSASTSIHLDDSGFLPEDSEHIYENDNSMCDQPSLSYLDYDDSFPHDDCIYHYAHDASYDFDHDDYIGDIQLKPRPTHKLKSNAPQKQTTITTAVSQKMSTTIVPAQRDP
ncbi:hypothetical protein BGZ51_001400 [Haplosporangium sp. Z 767]|nr:hypothetical protein BGZ51_001400 [Haplosporangium sp. Z 767]